MQDVSILLDLLIDGNAVTSCTNVEGGWVFLIKNMFREAPHGRQLVGDRIKLS